MTNYEWADQHHHLQRSDCFTKQIVWSECNLTISYDISFSAPGLWTILWSTMPRISVKDSENLFANSSCWRCSRIFLVFSVAMWKVSMVYNFICVSLFIIVISRNSSCGIWSSNVIGYSNWTNIMIAKFGSGVLTLVLLMELFLVSFDCWMSSRVATPLEVAVPF